MTSSHLRLAAKLAASGLALSAGPAAAAVIVPGPIIIDPCITYTYTLQGCQTPANSCDQAARDAAKTDANAICNQLIQDAGNTQAQSLPQRTVLVPTMTKADGTTVAPASTTKVAASQAEDPNTRSMSGLGSFYLGQVHLAQTYLPATGRYTDYLVSLRQQQRDTWNANGYVVDSCNEYVYEKYYDYSVFEDKAVTYGNNARSIYNTAYALSRVGAPPAYAIGSRALLDPIQRGKDGTPFTPAITFPTGQPKNQFFTVPLAASSKVLISQGSEDKVTVLPGNGGVIISLKSLQRPLNLSGVSFVDTTLPGIINQGASYYDESWAWHKSMAQRNATVLDEEMYDLERLQADFTALLKKREETAEAIATMFNSKPLPNATTVFEGQWWRDPVWNPDPELVTRYAQLGLNVLAQPAVTGLTSTTTATSTPAPQTLSATSTNTSLSTSAVVDPSTSYTYTMPAYASALDTSVIRTACSGNTIICLLYKLESLDAAIEDALHQAQTRGCLTFNTTGPAACDWSPKRFAQRVMGQYQGERENAYQKCMDYTDNDFASLKSRAMVAGAVNYPATDYTTSPTKLEQYFVRRDQYLKALKNTLPDLMDPVTGKARLKWESGDSYSMGGKVFGATASYQVGFELANLSASNECAASPHAYGTFDATARALGASVNLVHANASITDVHGDVDLDVFDNSIHVVDYHQDLPVGQFNVVSGSKSTSKTFVDVHADFVIVVVPVKLGAKVGGTVGLNYAVNVNHNVTTNASGCHVSSIGAGGSLEPFASVDGELYAGVDIFIASAGVKGKLQIVHASIPLKADAALTYGKNNLPVVTFDLATRADLKFTFMSGSIAAYVELGPCPFCVDFDANIVSWDGFHYDIPLFNKKLSVPLADIQALVASST